MAISSNIICVNQRQHYRVTIPEERPVTMILRDASITQRLDDVDNPPTTYRCNVRDLSIGGVRTTGLEADPQWKLGDHLGVELHIPDEDPLLLIAEVRRVVTEPEGMLGYGLAFIGAETIRKTFEAQEVLARVVSDLQRLHLQRRVQGADVRMPVA